MGKRYENKRHMAWVHEFKCCLATYNPTPDPLRPVCNGYVQAHHLLKPWDGQRGMGMKANDKNLIPLCMAHHNALHARGNELKFFEEATGDEGFGKMIAESIWVLSPYNDDG